LLVKNNLAKNELFEALPHLCGQVNKHYFLFIITNGMDAFRMGWGQNWQVAL
jgi:hypothetical protein